MEFLKERCYTALNADELKPGDKVITALNLYGIKQQVKMFTGAVDVIDVIQDEDYFNRFKVQNGESYPLAYLVERAENCTNCGSHEVCGYVQNVSKFAYLNRCKNYNPKTEQKHYRPFKDTAELIKVWGEKEKKAWGYNWLDNKQPMPLIWVRDPKRPKVNYLLNGLMGNEVHWGSYIFNMQELFDNFEFLDGSPCGVEE